MSVFCFKKAFLYIISLGILNTQNCQKVSLILNSTATIIYNRFWDPILKWIPTYIRRSGNPVEKDYTCLFLFFRGMESFSRFLSVCLSFTQRCFLHTADNHTYSMHQQAINLCPRFIPSSFISHTGSRMKHCLLENISY